MDGPPPPDGDVDRNSLLMGVSSTLTAIALLFVVTRVYSRVFITRSMWWDDWAIIATMVSVSRIIKPKHLS